MIDCDFGENWEQQEKRLLQCELMTWSVANGRFYTVISFSLSLSLCLSFFSQQVAGCVRILSINQTPLRWEWHNVGRHEGRATAML